MSMLINSYRYAGAAASFFLDDYTGATAAFGFRRLRSAYAGNACKVRRSSDGVTQDIGFTGNELDTASLASFIGASDADIDTWYDQTGNGNDFVTTATANNRPVLVIAGTLQTRNSKPTLRYSRSGAMTGFGGSLTGLTTKTIIAVADTATGGGNSVRRLLTSYAGSGSVGNECLFDWSTASSGTLRYIDGGVTLSQTGVSAAFACWWARRNGSNLEVGKNNSLTTGGSPNAVAQSNPYKIFEEGGTSTNESPYCVSELYIYGSDQSANAGSMYSDLAGYFSL